MESLHNMFHFILLFSLFFSCFRSEPLLPEQEVQTLEIISLKLRNTYWNLRPTSCSNVGDFNVTFGSNIFSNVNCDCSFNNNSVCHVTRIQLKGLNLTGELPAEFANLTHLGDINLSHNYIGGTIPRAFGQLNVVFLSLLGNRVHGLIPPELANVTTLVELFLEDNLLEGPIPQNFGSLIGLRRFVVSANKLNGTIPESFGNLRNLTDFRIDGNELSGKIPDFIGNWTNITRLDLQGTGLEGPIPLSISHLKNLIELRISDLSGRKSTIPNLKDMQSLHILILKSCLINGPIPEHIAALSQLKTLDLSFNRLTGEIPDSLALLNDLHLQYLYLNHNSLTGEIPSWISDSKQHFDVSYNNFTRTAEYNCQPSNVNLVSSMSSSKKNSVAWCLKKDLPCPRKPQYYSLFINCGGTTTTDWEGNKYEEDLVSEGLSHFSSYSSEKWAYSSTGVFMNNDRANFIAKNKNVSEAIYRTARLAPSSLKYYGLCLRKGSYKVRLHFAEIQYLDDKTYNSIGRRIFDVSIQGKVVRKNFNIAEEAKGFGKGITLENDVTVHNGTLEIHLYWAGKGTTIVPDRGVYGPLISAISVTPNFHVETGGTLSTGSIAGIVVGSLASVFLILLLLWRKGIIGEKDLEDKELRQAIELRTAYFSLRQIKVATNNFDPVNKIGEGGFGPVYKGVLPDDAAIAVKQLSSKSRQGNREFINEIGMIVAVQHPNLVKLYGCCIEGNQLLLIYEYMENNSLARALFGCERLNLDWPSRKKIFLQIARGLTYLHEESRIKIVHRDIKSTNVLLDRDLNAKICDFGLARLDEEENTHISTRVAGTIGYMAPEYAMRGYLTDKADVYSFGIVALEIVSGKSNTKCAPKEEFVYLLDSAYVLQKQGNLLDLVDPILGSNYSKKEALRMLNLALMCTNPSPTLRPSMSAVIAQFECKKKFRAPIVDQTTADNDINFKSFDKISMDSETLSYASSQESREERTMSTCDPCINSSVSGKSKDTDMDN
ncbi:putative LRR receptor-like serine/threonine-protein kinase [Heracleum sosnowskyi]|uniref:non-specific serine/threonine protein kinase n=1 Tax=Heracleum sosnowskyi TaxID=360622 RepID=A0AAD8LZE1_9APIA|nr:putative LRR receptor-like serine/threonine-protein kinase [Heracleum sosnowskyi]